jgi:GNAT superfamily N-acetyltransferase
LLPLALASLFAALVADVTDDDPVRRATIEHVRVRDAIAAHRARFPDLQAAEAAGLVPDEWWIRGAELERLRQHAFDALWAAREQAGLDPRTGEPVRRERRSNAAAHVRGGHYPDLLGDSGEVKVFDRDHEWIRRGRILHTASGPHRHFHHLRLVVDGEVVVGMTLHAERPWRGQQSATIDRVFTYPDHRRQGHAAELLEYARGYFRRVRHSRDLTEQGKAWKRSVR